jgi:hypothetical protein
MMISKPLFRIASRSNSLTFWSQNLFYRAVTNLYITSRLKRVKILEMLTWLVRPQANPGIQLSCVATVPDVAIAAPFSFAPHLTMIVAVV